MVKYTMVVANIAIYVVVRGAAVYYGFWLAGVYGFRLVRILWLR
jgi:hypothetical protein